MRYFQFFFLILMLHLSTSAQTVSPPAKKKKFTIESGVEGFLLQFSKVSAWNIDQKTVPRFTYYFNTGFDVNYKMHKHVRPFTGIHLRNIGLITRPNDTIKTKHRVYTLGAPLGLKFYLLNEKLMFKVGGDVGLALNYKIKNFINDTKTKNNEWFSDRVSPVFASVFFGVRYQTISLTANYYLNNFFNPSHIASMNVDGRIFTIGLGFAVDNEKYKKSMKKNSKSLDSM